MVLLHGPPGTGKTKTLVAGIQALAKQHQKVLATAPSNMAVDVLVERLAKAGLRVVRIGHPMKVSPDVLETTLDHQTEREPAYKRVVQTRREAEQSSARQIDLCEILGLSRGRIGGGFGRKPGRCAKKRTNLRHTSPRKY